MENLVDRICRHEGFRSHVYLDSQGYLSLGHGTTVGKVALTVEHLIRQNPKRLQAKGVGISKPVARWLVKDRVAAIRDELSKDAGWWIHSKIRRDVLVEMSYQLGVNGCRTFKRMWLALRLPTPDYELAAVEMMDSDWAKQTRARANDLAEIMRSGQL